MRIHDPSRLTAYLDGELDPAGRHRVEAALAASPELARLLLDLAEARALVEGLARPAAPPDLADRIVAEIRRPARPWSLRVGSARVASPRWLAVGSGVAAAGLVSMLLVSREVAMRPSPSIALADAAPDRPAPVAPRRFAPAAPSPEPAGPPTPIVASGRATAPAPSTTGTEVPGAVAQDARIAAFLTRPDVGRLIVRVDAIGPATSDRVRAAIDETPRRPGGRGRIEVARAAILGPEAMRGSLAFLVVLDHDRAAALRRSLESAIGRVEGPGPLAAFEVARLGRFEFFENPTIPRLGPPPDGLGVPGPVASKPAPSPHVSTTADMLPGEALHGPFIVPPRGPTREAAPDRPPATPPTADPPRDAAADAADSAPPEAVLVLVIPDRPPAPPLPARLPGAATPE